MKLWLLIPTLGVVLVTFAACAPTSAEQSRGTGRHAESSLSAHSTLDPAWRGGQAEVFGVPVVYEVGLSQGPGASSLVDVMAGWDGELLRVQVTEEFYGRAEGSAGWWASVIASRVVTSLILEKYGRTHEATLALTKYGDEFMKQYASVYGDRFQPLGFGNAMDGSCAVPDPLSIPYW